MIYIIQLFSTINNILRLYFQFNIPIIYFKSLKLLFIKDKVRLYLLKISIKYWANIYHNIKFMIILDLNFIWFLNIL